MAVFTRFHLVCVLGGHLGSGRISQGDAYPGLLGTCGTSELAVEAHPCGPCAIDGLVSASELSAWGGSSVGAACSSGFGRSDTMDGANASSGKISQLYGKIPVDLNPEVMLHGVTDDMKASFTSPAMW